MPYLFRTRDKEGNLHERWRFQVRMSDGRKKAFTGYTSKPDTYKLACKVEREQYEIREGLVKPTKQTSGERHASRSIREVAAEYLTWGKTQGGLKGRPWSDAHASNREVKLEWWITTLKLKTLADLEGIRPLVEREVGRLLNGCNVGERGRGYTSRTPLTVQRFQDAITGFCSWGFEREYLDRDPLDRLKPLPRSVRNLRRALTVEEIKSLMSHCHPKRKTLYMTALCTGLRANELRSLSVADLDLEHGGLRLRAEWTKNRKPGFQPLHPFVLEVLAADAEGKASHEPLLYVADHTWRDFNADREAAGILRMAPGGKVDFHSLRTTALTLADEAGGTAKQTQEFGRHATPQQTFGTYVKAREAGLAELAYRVGEKVVPAQILPKRAAAGAEGTTINTSRATSSKRQQGDLAGVHGNRTHPPPVRAARWL